MQRATCTILGLTVAVLAVPAAAATISMSFDQPFYTVGDTIELTITATIEEGEIATDDWMHVIVEHDPSRVTAHGALGAIGTLTQFDGAAPAIVSGSQGTCAFAIGRDNQCRVFDQIVSEFGSPVDAAVLTAVLTYTSLSVGDATFTFRDVHSADFIFFDLGDMADVGTAPPGVTIGVIPEPATAALLGLGLAGLALRRETRMRLGRYR